MPKMADDTKAELDWLRFFYREADFGPADGDVRWDIKRRYVAQGNFLPVGYAEEE